MQSHWIAELDRLCIHINMFQSRNPATLDTAAVLCKSSLSFDTLCQVYTIINNLSYMPDT